MADGPLVIVFIICLNCLHVCFAYLPIHQWELDPILGWRKSFFLHIVRLHLKDIYGVYTGVYNICTCILN